MMRKRFLAAVLLLTPLLTLTCLPARADFYSYTDSNGAVCMTNTLSAVPPQYRSGMKVVKEEAPPKQEAPPRPRKGTTPVQAPQPETAAPPDDPPAQPGWQLPGRFAPATPLLYSGVIVTIFLVIRRLVQQLSSALLARMIYVGFFLGVFVYAYKSYAEHVVGNYFTVKARILKMYEKANRRDDSGLQPAGLPVVREE